MERDKKIIKTSLIGIMMNIILAGFKLFVGIVTNSIAIITDSINNSSDVLSAGITIIGTKLAARKPDKEHPYGHGRIEYVASVAIALLVFAAGFIALKESFGKIIDAEKAEYTLSSLVIISVAILAKILFSTYSKKVGDEIKSQSLLATSTDSLMDAFLSLTTLVAAFISMIWHVNIEGYLGVVISLVIIKASIDILKVPLTSLIGYRADPELTNKIKEKVNEFKEVQGAYDLILHSYGPNTMIGSIHIQVKDSMTANEIHKLSKKIQEKIFNEFGVLLTIGIYASNTENKEFSKIKNSLNRIIKKYDDIIQLHGFYVDTDQKHISFDLIIKYDCENAEELKDKVVEEIKTKYPEYDYYAVVDNDYSD